MNSSLSFDELLSESIRFLERNRRCKKHHVEHTGSNTYLLDFYSATGQIEKGKELVGYLLSLITRDGDSLVFYPGRLNQMNMANNVIDTGSAVDTVSRFLHEHRELFSQDEHDHARQRLKEVVDTYLRTAGSEKPISNQRLWGVSGLASYARYTADASLNEIITHSIERAFSDMTVDGFFRYYPDAAQHGAFAGYDDISAFYQSRHLAFMRYALEATEQPMGPYEERMRTAERALLSLYLADGYKDLRLDCKRWYWLGPYEVASHAFDAYALAYSTLPGADIAMHNVIHTIRSHFTREGLCSRKGINLDFQCAIFWTAHLAWLIRVPGAKERFNKATSLQPFTYTFIGKEVVSHTEPEYRFLMNLRKRVRNQTVGLLNNGLRLRQSYWSYRMPWLPQSWMFSVRESLNHAWYAARGGAMLESVTRLVHMFQELIMMLLPRYALDYGQIVAYRPLSLGRSTSLELQILPESKYGTPQSTNPKIVIVDVPEGLYCKIVCE